MALGRASRPRTVSLEEGARPDAQRCPACDEPLFVWIETEGWGPREDQIIDRCENCGLVVDRDADHPDPAAAAAELFGPAGASNGNGSGAAGAVTVRAPNAESVQAWLGAENWAALRPGDHSLKPTARAAELLAGKRGLKVTRVRFATAAGMAAMWQTLLNLLTFHRDFAAQASSGGLRPGRGKGLAAYAIDVLVTVFAAVPTALLAVLIEGGAVLAKRGGVIEITAEPS
jgi:hypothetical protein